VHGVFHSSNSGVIISNPIGARKMKVYVPMSFYALKKYALQRDTVSFREMYEASDTFNTLKTKVKVLFYTMLLDFRKSTDFCKVQSLHVSVLVNENEQGVTEN
jgi:hypothetical protein